MSEWVSESEVSSRLGYKILIAGLSEAGKTAVKRVFFLGQGSQDVDNLAATINYERLIANIKDTPVTIVDLGGQKVFLKRFLGSFSPFIFSAVKSFLFLIDVENKATKNNSIQYFSSCVEKLEAYSPKAEYFVFFHKNDLVRHLPNYESTHGQLKEQFQLESPKKITFFRTTIYSPETVVNGFGRIFELAMPQLARSEYVGGQQIGQVEEYAEKFVIFRESSAAETAITPKTPIDRKIPPSHTMAPSKQQIAAPTSGKMAADPAALARLQRVMQSSLKGGPSSSTPNDSEGMAGDAGSLEKLQGLMKSAAVESSLAEETDPTEALEEHHLDLLHSIDEAIEELEFEEEVAEEVVEPEEDDQSRIDFLANFYGIPIAEAKAVVESGYADIFEIGATSRIPIPLILEVLLKYIPFIKSEGLDPDVLESDQLLDILAAHLKGFIKEKDLLKCLIIAVKRIDLTVEEIVDHFFAKPVQRIRAVRGDVKATLEEPPELIPPSPPSKPDSIETIIDFSNSEGIGFSLELTSELNCRLSFFNQSRPVGNALVSGNISRDELMYLLQFEVQLPLEGGATAIYAAAKLLHDTIKEHRGET